MTTPRGERQGRLTARLGCEGALAGLGDAPAAARAQDLLHGEVRWQEFLAEVQRHRLAPLFHLGLHICPALRGDPQTAET